MTTFSTRHLLRRLPTAFGAAFLSVSLAPGQTTFTSEAAFLAAAGGATVIAEHFTGLPNGTPIPTVLGGLASLSSGGTGSATPTVSLGAWGAGCGALAFSGGAAIPEPRFGGRPLIVTPSQPVFGIGAQVFDDYDGSPGVATITLTVQDTTGARAQVSETCDRQGDVGFLGITWPTGIVSAEFTISSTGGNLEVDRLTVLDISGVVGQWSAFGAGCAGTAGTPTLTANAVPRIGRPFTCNVSGLPATGGVFGVIGLANAAGVDLSALGMTNCTLWTGIDATITLTNTGGAATWVTPVPGGASLIGTRFFQQAIAIDVNANPLGVIVSNAGAAVIGP